MKQIAIRVRSGPEYPFGAIQGASVVWLGHAYRAAYAPNPKLSLMVGDGRPSHLPATIALYADGGEFDIPATADSHSAARRLDH